MGKEGRTYINQILVDHIPACSGTRVEISASGSAHLQSQLGDPVWSGGSSNVQRDFNLKWNGDMKWRISHMRPQENETVVSPKCLTRTI